MTFTPRLDVLPEAQRAVWPALAGIPDSFVLYGGTALALRLGHRASVDFNFFSSEPIDSVRPPDPGRSHGPVGYDAG